MFNISSDPLQDASLAGLSAREKNRLKRKQRMAAKGKDVYFASRLFI